MFGGSNKLQQVFVCAESVSKSNTANSGPSNSTRGHVKVTDTEISSYDLCERALRKYSEQVYTTERAPNKGHVKRVRGTDRF